MDAVFSSVWFSFPNKLLDFGLCSWWSITEVSVTTAALATLVTSLLTVFLSTAAWRCYFEKCRDPSSSLPLPPGSFGWPFIGETLAYIKGGVNEASKRRQKYGCVYKTHFLGSPTVRIESDEQIAALLNKGLTGGASGGALPKSVRFVAGNSSVIVVSGNKHASLKKNLSHAFAPVRLRDYLPSVQDCVHHHVTTWVEGPHERQMLGFDACKELVADLILETVIGCTRKQDPDGVVKNAFFTLQDNLFCIPLNIPGMAFHKVKKARQVLVDFIKERLASKTSSVKDFVTILDVLLAHQRQNSEASGKTSVENDFDDSENPLGSCLSKAEVIDNVVSLMSVGTDTVTSAMCSTLKLLGKHPEKLSMLRKELDSQDLLNTDQINDYTLELLQSLPYVQAVTKEVLRLLPPIGGFFRSTSRTVELEDYQIPGNWRVVYSVRGVHQETSAFTEKELFLPERWLDPMVQERLKSEFSCSYVPFGVGSRACLGKDLALLELNVFVIEVARFADWTLLNPDAKRLYLPVEKPVDDLPVLFKKRKWV